METYAIKNLSFRYPETGIDVLKDITFSVNEGEFITVCGPSGCGKSTLLRHLKPDLSPHGVLSGEIFFEGKPISDLSHREQSSKIGFVMQSPENQIVTDKVWHELAFGLESLGYDNNTIRKRVAETASFFGIQNYFEKSVLELSGGQKQILNLSSIMAMQPSVLILDEPTNDLDITTLTVLEDYLDHFEGIVIIVSHDRYFLDSVCNRIVEVDKGQIYSYETNYSGYLAAKQEREDIAWAGERKRQSILRKEIEWMQRGARARSTKQKAHIQRYEALRDQKKPDVDKKIEIGSVSSRMGKTTVELSHITKTYGDHVLISDFSYIFLKNDRIGFVGKNGCGKTTLMKIIDGRILPNAGEVTIGQTIKIGYYTQEIEQDENAGIAYMDPNLRVIDYIKNTAEYVRTEDGLVSASAMLDKFLFPPEEQYGQIKKLSGGEKRRLNLLRVLMEAPNVLILDEPTNDLDITTLTILEDYLDHYDGIVITVSHDRYFLDRVVHRIFAFEGNGKLCQYEGGYTDYHRRAEEEGKFVDTAGDSFRKNEETANVQEKQATEDSRSTWKHENKLKFSYKEQKEYETIEDDIAALETRLGEIDGEMASCARDFVKLNELTEEKTQLETQLEEKMDRWTYLEELAAKILQQNA